MKRTVISYVIDDIVTITKIENVVTRYALRTCFGIAVKRAYIQRDTIRYYRRNSEVVVFDGNGNKFILAIGAEFTNDTFGKIIATMKAAGDRLQQLKTELPKEVKTITI